MRILITQSPFNLNWLEFSQSTSTADLQNNAFVDIKVFPNPSSNRFELQAEIAKVQDVQLEIFNATGGLVKAKSFEKISKIQEQVSLGNFPSGIYFLILRLEDGTTYSTKLIKALN